MLALATEPASAQQPAALLSSYEVPPAAACPSKSEFIRALATRGVSIQASSTVPPAAPGNEANRLEVRITFADPSYLAEVRVGRGAALPPPRLLRGSSCAEVALAAQLSAALALQNSAISEALAPLARAAPRLPAQLDRSPKLSPSGEWSAGVSVGLQTTPLVGPGLRLGALTRFERASRSGFSTFTAARAELAGAMGKESVGAASVRLATLMLALDGCVASYRAGILRLDLACVGVDFGVLAANASGVQRAQNPRRPWAAASAGGGIGLKAARNCYLELDAAPLLSITRYSFELDNPQQTLSAVPSWGFRTRFVVRLSF